MHASTIRGAKVFIEFDRFELLLVETRSPFLTRSLTSFAVDRPARILAFLTLTESRNNPDRNTPFGLVETEVDGSNGSTIERLSGFQ